MLARSAHKKWRVDLDMSNPWQNVLGTCSASSKCTEQLGAPHLQSRALKMSGSPDMMRGSQARSSLPQGWSQTVESRINIGLDKERDFCSAAYESVTYTLGNPALASTTKKTGTSDELG